MYMKRYTVIVLSFLLVVAIIPSNVAYAYKMGESPESDGSYYTAASKDDSSNLYKEQQEVVQVFNNGAGKIYLTNNDIYLMSQIVYAESKGEPYDGKVAVASVILNRTLNPGFPKTVEGVITQKNAFSCVKDGKISVTPDEDCKKAVLDAIKGVDPTDRAIFFYNPKTATSQWMKNVEKVSMKTIGNHVFFKAKK